MSLEDGGMSGQRSHRDASGPRAGPIETEEQITIAKAKRLFLQLCGYRLSCHSLRMGVTLKLLSHEGGQFIPVILQVIQHR